MNQKNMFNAVILAGRQAIKTSGSSGVKDNTGSSGVKDNNSPSGVMDNTGICVSKDIINKALLKINGRVMVEYIVDAISGARGIEKVVIIGPATDFTGCKFPQDCLFVDSLGTVMQNIVKAILYIDDSMPLLISTSDIPLVTVDAVNDFVEQSLKSGGDICYPIIDKTVNDMKYPEFERTYVKLRDGTFTGGNMFFVNPKCIAPNVDVAEKLYDARKNPMKMASILGPELVLRFLTGTLTIRSVEKRFEKITGLKGAAVISKYPEIGNDVDKTSDIIIATAYLGGTV